MNDIQITILRNLITNEAFTRRVIPYLKKEYFEGDAQIAFNQVVNFVSKYNKMPTQEAMLIELNDSNISEDRFQSVALILKEATIAQEIDLDWLMEHTEKWCKDRAVFLAIMESIEIINNKSEDKTENAIPDILSDALSVTFDNAVGHDYIDDYLSRYDFYNTIEDRIEFDLEYFNKITKGGIPRKTLSVALAGTGVGKSLFMCHCAAAAMTQGRNILYITMEMAEERIAERIDANLFNTPIDQIGTMDKDAFGAKINKLQSKNLGKLIIKEYPTASAHTGHFRALIKELQMKKQFKPDMIFVDYLNICASSRMKMGGSVNTYSYIKSIAEELRGLAVENNVPIVTATQTTRSGYGNTDVGLEDTSESFGLPATADFMFALVSNEELENLGQLMVKQLKNRFADPNANKRFIIGVDRSRMKLFDAEENAQSLIGDASSTPVAVPKKDQLDFSGFNA